MDKRIEEKIKQYESEKQLFIQQKENAIVNIHRLNGAIAAMRALEIEDAKTKKEKKSKKKAK